MPKNPEPPRAEVEAALETVLRSDTFGRSERLRRFLSFVVTESLAGRAERLKEYTLATEVFDRGEEFDSRIDTIVRVEAGRLRGKLRDYYAAEGQDDVVRIEVPKGAYSAVFHTATPHARRGWRVVVPSSIHGRSWFCLSTI